MISYALSTCAFGGVIDEITANALRNGKFRKFELLFSTAVDGEVFSKFLQEARKLVKEGVMSFPSAHMPFQNGNNWDLSCTDEKVRRSIVANHIELLYKNADIIGRNITVHASGEPELESHPVRMVQIHRTLEDLMPVAEDLNLTFNIEYLPRTCLGNSVKEIQDIIADFSPERVGICMDVNHIMDRYRELPDIIDELADRINTFHISDYDGVDETHWIPGQGIYDWGEVLRAIRKIDHDVLLILETDMQLKRLSRKVDSFFALRQNERACWFMENYDRLASEASQFEIPGNI